jgi:CRP-like cAMP-binding protein
MSHVDPDVDPEVLAVVRDLLLFQLLDAAAQARIATVGALMQYEAGEIVIREGDEGDTFCIIARGSGRVTVEDVDGERREVARLAPGDFFGEMSLVGSGMRQATVACVEPMLVLELPGPSLRELIAQHPALNEIVTAVGVRRSEENMRQLMTDG